LKANLLNEKCLIKLVVEVAEKYKTTKNNKIMIYFKMTTRKLD